MVKSGSCSSTRVNTRGPSPLVGVSYDTHTFSSSMSLRSVHFYRKVPRDLTEATVSGGTISVVSTIVMLYLFYTNVNRYLSLATATSIVLDSSDEKKLPLNFNVTLHNLPCRFVSLDIVDAMGSHLQNVSSNIIKTRVAETASGTPRVLGFGGAGAADSRELKHAESRAPDTMGLVPKVSPEMDMVQFLEQIHGRRLVLVNFFAPWCPWSRRLAPVWEEAFASVIRQPYGGEVLLAKADCTAAAQELCQKQHIHAFPTIKIYRKHNPHSHESYVGDRTHEALETFVANNVHDPDSMESVNEGQSEVGAGEHEGCVVRGVILVNRVPGNFHLSAHSKSHSFQPHKLNLSHSVTSMTFGKTLTPTQLRLLPTDVETVRRDRSRASLVNFGFESSRECH